MTDVTERGLDTAYSPRLTLASLWAALMFLFVYADILSLFRPGELGEIIDGNMGPVRATQASLLVAAIGVMIPALMIVVAAAAPFPAVRWLNIVVGGLYVLVSVGNLIGETWAYYLLFGAVEIVLAGLVVRTGMRWLPATRPAGAP